MRDYPTKAPLGSLWNPPSNGTRTSDQAAERIKPSADTLRQRVLAFIDGKVSGCTDEEIQEGLAMSANTERPRRGELVEMGLVIDSGRTRETRSGREAIVWILREAA